MLSIVLTDRFTKAFEYAHSLHAGHLRKGTDIPYVSHLMAVASIVMENGENEDEVIAALLHDGPEDQGGKPVLDEICRLFGDNVKDIVEQCSDTLESEKPDWKQRKKRYIEKLKTVENSSVILVSLADKLHNSRAILNDYRREGEEFWSRFNSSRDNILWYYKSLVDIYKLKTDERHCHLVSEISMTVRMLNEEINK